MKHLLASSPLLLAVAAAQSPPASLPYEVRWGHDLYAPPGGQNVTYGRVAAARIGDDTELDVFAVRTVDGVRSAVYCAAPMRHNVVVQVAAGFVDATVLCTGAVRDPIVVLRGTGLDVYRTPVGAQQPAVAPVATLGGVWVGAQGLWPGQLGDGSPVLLGVNQAGTQILRTPWNGTSFGATTAVATVPGTTKVMTMDWDGDGDVELVVQLGTLVVVMTWEGVPLTSFAFDAAHAHMVTVSRGNGSAWYARDLLVAYGWYGGQYQLLAAAGYPNPQTPPSLALRGFGPACGWTASDLAAVELEPSGAVRLQDLVLGNRTDQGSSSRQARAWIVRRVDSPAVFAAVEQADLVTGVDFEDAAVDAVCGADFDGDGDGDVVAVQSKVEITGSAGTKTASVLQVYGSDLAPGTRVQVKIASWDEPAGQPFQCVASYVMPANWATLVGPGESVAIEAVGWFANNGVLENDASILPVTFPLAPLLPLPAVLTLQRQANAALQLVPEQWELEVHARLVVTGPQGRRELAPWVNHFSSNHGFVNERRDWRGLVVDGKRPGDGEPADPNTGGSTTPPRTDPVRRP